MRRKWLLCGILCGVVSLSVFGQNVGASNYDKQIKETEKQQKEWENKADSLQKEIEEICNILNRVLGFPFLLGTVN